jgi:hypothetical protein
MKSIFVKLLTIILFVSFVLPAGNELSSQQAGDKKPGVQIKDRQRLRDGSCDGTFKRKHKKIKKHKKLNKKKRGRS